MLFYAVVTELGRPKLAASMLPGGAPLSLSMMALGDGGGAAVTPVANRASLVNERHRRAINSVTAHPTDAERVIVECVIPNTVGGWVIREFGLYDDGGDLVVYGNFPETYKPVLADGVGRDLTIRPHIYVGSDAEVTMLVDPSVTLATHQHVAAAIAAAFRADRPFRYFRHF